MATVIDGLIHRQEEILAFLKESGELSLALEFESNLKKLLVMACGSYFESEVISWLEQYSSENAEPRLCSLIRNKALKRQYFTMFDFEAGTNANRFWGLFGADFKESVSREISQDQTHERAIRDFLKLGLERNLLAHANLAAATVDLTLEEVKQMYMRASMFIDLVKAKFPCGSLEPKE